MAQLEDRNARQRAGALAGEYGRGTAPRTRRRRVRDRHHQDDRRSAVGSGAVADRRQAAVRQGNRGRAARRRRRPRRAQQQGHAGGAAGWPGHRGGAAARRRARRHRAAARVDAPLAIEDVVRELGQSPRIGTSSVRRVAQLTRLFPGAPSYRSAATWIRGCASSTRATTTRSCWRRPACSGWSRARASRRTSRPTACVPAPGPGDHRRGDSRRRPRSRPSGTITDRRAARRSRCGTRRRPAPWRRLPDADRRLCRR